MVLERGGVVVLLLLRLSMRHPLALVQANAPLGSSVRLPLMRRIWRSSLGFWSRKKSWKQRFVLLERSVSLLRQQQPQ